ncbi:hypothetical protein KSC_083060 [Ktedonobacter sp. SOSP1-52]|uniref:hypothetical protein n=1 Tax=Ktedonobacter sp. SOSP1-52 TaxID=2778366 RepID=UPI0019157765|nr:hypothetical protein [Ktedonobacter sp. SOSP1-52]GHO69414.1 hypothetical protein KSC_083060 [Ktedonobacter sp. SOSP1-52]
MPTCVGIHATLFLHLTRTLVIRPTLFLHLTRTLVIRPTLFLHQGNRGVAAVRLRRTAATPLLPREPRSGEKSADTDM